MTPLRFRYPFGILCLVIVCLLTGMSVSASAQFETRGTRAMPSESGAFAAGDFNNDGKLDIAVLEGKGLSIALGNGDGIFQPTQTYPEYTTAYTLAVGDFNADGNLDIVLNVPGYNNGIDVLLGNGDGTFQAPITSAANQYPTFVAVGDFNGDGKLDVVLADYPDISVLLGSGDGTFQPPVDNNSFIAPANLAVGDFNNDRRLDVAVVGSNGANLGVLLGNGDGTLQPSLTHPLFYTPNTVAVGDFDRDGNLDVAIEGRGPVVTVLSGNGAGGFRSTKHYDITSGSGQIVAADLSENGLLDLATAELSPAGMSILAGVGNGTFQPAHFYPAGNIVELLVPGDFNGDRKVDVVLLDRALGAITLLNTGAVVFSPTTPLVFKKQKTGTTSAPQTVKLTNSGKTALKISAMKAAGQFGMTSTCGSSVAAGANCVISVTFSPTSAGVKSGTVTMKDSASSKPQVIELSGTGTE